MARRSGRDGRGRSGRGTGRSARPQTKRHYPRTARLNTLLQEIAADFVERLDDDRLPLITVTGVEVDADLNRAQVFVTGMDSAGGDDALPSADADAELLDALSEHAKALRSAVGSQARLRKTPEIVFRIDPGVRSGARIEQILATLDIDADDDLDDEDSGGDGDDWSEEE